MDTDKPTLFLSCCPAYLLWSSRHLLLHRLLIGWRLTDMPHPSSQTYLVAMATKEETTTTLTQPPSPSPLFWFTSTYLVSALLLFSCTSLEGKMGGCVSWAVEWNLVVGYTWMHLRTIKGKHFRRWQWEWTVWIPQQRKYKVVVRVGQGLPTLNVSVPEVESGSSTAQMGGYSTLGTTAEDWIPPFLSLLL